MGGPGGEWMSGAAKRRRYLVGVSGGADSVALLHMLVRSGFGRLVVCHLDHGLRGKASAADARFVEGLARSLGTDFEGGREDLRRVQGSMETAAREARHRFFARCGREWRCGRLILAHHADDQAETVLWNLIRGSRGASGMAETQELDMDGRRMEVIRPLLGVRRTGLREWLTDQGLEWREDGTNAEPVAVRNRLRNEVLPMLSEATGRDAVVALARAASAGAELREIERWAVEAAAAVDPQGRLHVGRLRELPEALRRACVHSYLREHGISDLDRAAVERVLGMLEPGGPARVTLAGGCVVRRKEARIFL
jgi:tRNA(Ile)-lysidine synthase